MHDSQPRQISLVKRLLFHARENTIDLTVEIDQLLLECQDLVFDRLLLFLHGLEAGQHFIGTIAHETHELTLVLSDAE